jgi:hypothetical protein
VIAFGNRCRVIDAFSELGKPDDTFRTEVQDAYLLFGFLLCVSSPLGREEAFSTVYRMPP